MTEVSSPSPATPSRELVGIFAKPRPLMDCLRALQSAGFAHEDLSLLSTHEAVEAAADDGGSLQDRLMPLLSEARYEVPLVSGVLIALASGPTAAVLAGIAAAGVGVIAVRELLDEAMSLPDTEAFADAVEAGEILLWVAVSDSVQEERARTLLSAHGARNIHLTERS